MLKVARYPSHKETTIKTKYTIIAQYVLSHGTGYGSISLARDGSKSTNIIIDCIRIDIREAKLIELTMDKKEIVRKFSDNYYLIEDDIDVILREITKDVCVLQPDANIARTVRHDITREFDCNVNVSITVNATNDNSTMTVSCYHKNEKVEEYIIDLRDGGHYMIYDDKISACRELTTNDVPDEVKRIIGKKVGSFVDKVILMKEKFFNID